MSMSEEERSFARRLFPSLDLMFMQREREFLLSMRVPQSGIVARLA